MKKTEENKIKSAIEEFFKVLNIDGTFELAFGEDIIDVVLEAKDTSLVIGYHGETLEALQLVLALVVSGKFIRVSLEVGDYKKKRSEFLKVLATKTKDRVLIEGREISLPELKSWERRVVHLLLQEDKEVVSESVGEGKNRTLVIKPRT